MPYKSREKHNECMSMRVAKRRAAWIASKGGVCAICGASGEMHIDHIDPELKEKPINFGHSDAALKEELEKCQILCPACHKTKTARQLATIFPHHTKEGYDRGCRCQLCAAANRREEAVIPHGTEKGYKHYYCRCEACTKAWQEKRSERKQPGWTRSEFKGITHGTSTAYCHHACRCDICRAFMTEKTKREWAQKKAARGPLPKKEPAPIVHGKYYTYCHHACRCDECKSAALAYREEKKRGGAMKDAAPESV